jgi:hypothetical protein
MQLRPDIQIQSVLKAFTDVILPALDPANPLAQEQARLCMGHLGVLAARLSLQYRYDRDELERWRALMRRIREQPGALALAPGAAAALAGLESRADDVLARARAEPQELVDAVRALREATGRLVQQAMTSDPQGARSRELEREVMQTTKQQLLRERSWLAPQGWESDPAAIPPILSLLAPADGVAVHSTEGALQ